VRRGHQRSHSSLKTKQNSKRYRCFAQLLSLPYHSLTKTSTTTAALQSLELHQTVTRDILVRTGQHYDPTPKNWCDYAMHRTNSKRGSSWCEGKKLPNMETKNKFRWNGDEDNSHHHWERTGEWVTNHTYTCTTDGRLEVNNPSVLCTHRT